MIFNLLQEISTCPLNMSTIGIPFHLGLGNIAWVLHGRLRWHIECIGLAVYTSIDNNWRRKINNICDDGEGNSRPPL